MLSAQGRNRNPTDMDTTDMQASDYQKCGFTIEKLVDNYGQDPEGNCKFCAKKNLLCLVADHGATQDEVAQNRAYWRNQDLQGDVGAGAPVLEAIRELIKDNKEIREEVHAVALRQHAMNEKLPKITEVIITPSEYKKSIHKDTFLDLIDIFGFGCGNICDKVERFSGTPPLKSAELDYTFHWDGQVESASYEPLQEHLRACGISTVKIGEGQGLPDGLLYREEIWTLKKNTSLSSEDLRKTGEQPVFKYILRGRTDLVRTKDSAEPVGKSNNRYFIEIKRVADFVEEDSLREAVLQLIGGNASNSFHSPPVLLTNLAKKHYVLYISLVGDPTVALRFKLNVIRMPSFGVAIAFLEERTAEMKSVTLHFGRKPTPRSSPPKATNASETTEDVDDIADRFGNVYLEEVVTDDAGNVV